MLQIQTHPRDLTGEKKTRDLSGRVIPLPAGVHEVPQRRYVPRHQRDEVPAALPDVPQVGEETALIPLPQPPELERLVMPLPSRAPHAALRAESQPRRPKVSLLGECLRALRKRWSK
jgi:hypothetical protein